MKTLIISLIIGFLLFELAEHVLFPLVWLLFGRKKVSVCDVQGMVGKTAEVRQWEGNRGKVEIGGELWNASGDDSFAPGSKVAIESVDGLVLRVKSPG